MTYKEYKNKVIESALEKFNNKSLEERNIYFNKLIDMHSEDLFVSNNRRWFNILKLMSIKTIQINKLKEFYEGLDAEEKKEFQTELHEMINDHEFDWKLDNNIDDSDKFLKPFYSLDTIDSKLEENKAITDNKFIDRCSDKVVEDFKTTIEDYTLLMKDNLSDNTKDRLFSLPEHMRVYAYMTMYNTIKFYSFEDSYLTDNYNHRQKIKKTLRK